MIYGIQKHIHKKHFWLWDKCHSHEISVLVREVLIRITIQWFILNYFTLRIDVHNASIIFCWNPPWNIFWTVWVPAIFIHECHHCELEAINLRTLLEHLEIFVNTDKVSGDLVVVQVHSSNTLNQLITFFQDNETVITEVSLPGCFCLKRPDKSIQALSCWYRQCS